MPAAQPATNDPQLESWVESANDPATDFPIQNLPFGRFRRGADEPWRIGVAIGDQVLDLRACGLVDHADMHRLMALPPQRRRALREAISGGLRRGGPDLSRFRGALHAQSGLELGLPCEIRNYTDFYVGIHHATAVGRLLRPENPLLPNYKWVPIGYHGRASSIQASGHSFHRPRGQVMEPDAPAPALRPSARVDLELELGIFVGAPNALGEPVPIAQAEEHVFGLALLNDWSARDLQAWEYQPLGPFLAKNFASTISPWVVTVDALEPFRLPWTRAAGDPQPLPYLHAPSVRESGAVDVQLEVWLQTARMRAAGQAGDCISRSNYAQAAYWSMAQLVAHHTVNGCNLQAGDLLGTGTLSGPGPGQRGSLVEMTQGGKHPIALSNGERRGFLEDGDAVVLKGHCAREGWRRIGFGECRATVLPALATP